MSAHYLSSSTAHVVAFDPSSSTLPSALIFFSFSFGSMVISLDDRWEKSKAYYIHKKRRSPEQLIASFRDRLFELYPFSMTKLFLPFDVSFHFPLYTAHMLNHPYNSPLYVSYLINGQSR